MTCFAPALLSATVVLAGCFGSVASSGQSVAPSAQSGTASAEVVVVPRASTGCPVSMRAQHVAGWDMVRTGRASGEGQRAENGKAPQQRLHLTLSDFAEFLSARIAEGRIAEAQIAVRGTNGAGQGIPLQEVARTERPGPADATKRVRVRFREPEQDQLSTELVLRGFTSIRSLTLESLTFSDGTTWHPEKAGACVSVPDPLMLVGAADAR